MFSDSKLLIVGSPGSLEDEVFKYELWAKAKDLDLTGAIEFRPFTNNIEATLDEIDILLHNPETQEPFGQSLLEAQSRGCVVFTRAPSGAQDFIKNGINGFLSNATSKESPTTINRLLNISIADLRGCSREGIFSNDGRFQSITVAKHLEELIQLNLPKVNSNADSIQIRVAHLDHDNKRGGAELALFRMLGGPTSWKPKAFVEISDGPGVFDGLENKFGRYLVSRTSWNSRSIKLRGNVRARAVFENVIALFLVARRLRKSPEFKACEVIHANTTRSLLAAVLAKLPNQKILFHLRDDLSKYITSFVGSRLVKFVAFRKVDGIVSNSQYSLDVLGTIPRRVVTQVIPSPIGAFEVESSRAHTSSKGAEEKLVICMVARLSPWKGQMLLLEAFAEVAKSAPSVELWLAGSSDFETTDFRSELVNRSIELGVGNQVRMLGHVSDIPGLLKKVDICVQSSTQPEPMGQNVLQYLAAGKPSIVASEGGPQEWVRHLITGLHFTARDRNSLQDALALLINDPNLRFELSRNAKKVIPMDFDSQMNKKFGELVAYLSKNTIKRGMKIV
jgi:glycosyltransferase involved in cell wall biosynthesis